MNEWILFILKTFQKTLEIILYILENYEKSD